VRDLYLRGLSLFAATPAGTWFVREIGHRIDPYLLRMTGGRLSSISPLAAMLLMTTGAKSGRSRAHPLAYLVDDDGLIVVASNFGGPRHPAWYHNLLANPKVEVLAGEHTGSYMAHEITDEAQRERAWALAVQTAEVWAGYEARAGQRRIPLIRLKQLDFTGP
jgi:deazaflavin-dependent oxidoreductase (nitroreductase family)